MVGGLFDVFEGLKDLPDAASSRLVNKGVHLLMELARLYHRDAFQRQTESFMPEHQAVAALETAFYGGSIDDGLGRVEEVERVVMPRKRKRNRTKVTPEFSQTPEPAEGGS